MLTSSVHSIKKYSYWGRFRIAPDSLRKDGSEAVKLTVYHLSSQCDTTIILNPYLARRYSVNTRRHGNVNGQYIKNIDFFILRWKAFMLLVLHELLFDLRVLRNTCKIYFCWDTFPDYQIFYMIRPSKCGSDPERELRLNKADLHWNNLFPWLSVRMERHSE